MRVGIVGAGRIGGNAARLFVQAGHEVMVSYSRDLDKLERLAATIGATVGSPTEAADFGDALMLSVPWALVYGEEYHEAEARRFVTEISAGSSEPVMRASSPTAGS